jgi:hypothetical protein
VGPGERTQVGISLDALRDVLSPYVDAAMSALHGPDWNLVVAAEDAARIRRPQRPVSKRDLHTLLNVILHRRMAPWSSVDYSRIRAYTSEILSVRNLHAHGDDCVGEHARLLDTASRLLRSLSLPPPPAFHAVDSVDAAAVPLADPAIGNVDPLTAEFDRLGVPGSRLLQLWGRAMDLRPLLIDLLDKTTTPGSDSAKGVQESELPPAAQQAQKIAAVGGEVVDLLAETYELEDEDDPRVKTFALAARALLSDPILAGAVLVNAAILRSRELGEPTQEPGHDLEGPGKPSPPSIVRERLDQIDRVVPSPEGRRQQWIHVKALAGTLPDGDMIPQMLALSANSALLELLDKGDDGLEIVRDSIARVRMLAGQQPGSTWESSLVALFRREGRICNDSGRTEEALRAFARADEILDRYPAADPDLRR